MTAAAPRRAGDGRAADVDVDIDVGAATPPRRAIAYADVGVDVDAADEAVRRLAPHARSTFRAEVLSDIGAFGAVTALPSGYRAPVLVSANDGAGTKPLIAAALGVYDTIGIDVVAMCVDDAVTLNAEPLLFHDQITCDRVDPAVIEAVVSGLAVGCRIAGCSLVGGEIAEHPDAVAPRDAHGHLSTETGLARHTVRDHTVRDHTVRDHTVRDPASSIASNPAIDIAGFVVAVAERADIPMPLASTTAQFVGIASPGLRCNGYSLARRVLLPAELSLDAHARALREPAWPGAQTTLGTELLRPSEVYAPAVRMMFRDCGVLGAAHITGGGLAANVARMLSRGVDAVLSRSSWPTPPIFRRIAHAGPVTAEEMERVFNLGLGMVVAVPPDAVDAAVAVARRHGHDAWHVGHATPGTGTVHLADRLG